MKTKPIIIAAVAIVVLAIGAYFIFFRGKSVSSAKESEITLFLKNFNRQVEKGNLDSLNHYFANRQKGQVLNTLLTTLINDPKAVNTETVFNLRLDIDNSKISFYNPALAGVTIPVTFSGDHLTTKHSSLTFIIQKDEDNRYRIYSVDGTAFMSDYQVYKGQAWQKNYTDKEIYSPATLKAFTDAANLKVRYDSVIWFSHIKDKTYFYVVKGNWQWNYFNGDDKADSVKAYQIGLVGPDLKELIPAKYDIIHSIGSSFPGLVEVEKYHKRGLYDLSGKVVLPVEYDEIFPLNDSENIAAIRKGNDYFWLKSDFTVSVKEDIRISDIFSKLKQPASFTLKADPAGNITEFNSKERHGAIYLPPSYLVDLNLLPQIKEFQNPLRKHVYFDEASSEYIVKAKALPVKAVATDGGSWFQTAFYSIRDYFIGGRSEFYDSSNLVLIDNKKNKMYAYALRTDISNEEGGADYSGKCNEFSVNTVTDSLLEIKVTSTADIELYNNKTYLGELPVFHYLKIENGKAKETLNTKRVFSFTKYQKMDDHFINGCYVIGKLDDDGKYKIQSNGAISAEVLRYMKNEIYADYNYKFKDKRWTEIFSQQFYGSYKAENTSVQDSLTEIDKYNIQWIDKKLKSLPVIKKNTLALNN